MHTRELAKIYRESAARITKRLGELRAAMRAETDPGRVCFAFVPLVVEAVWYRHPEASLKEMTRELSLKEMARHPKEGLLHWLNSLPGYLRTLPAETDAAPISRVVESIRMDWSASSWKRPSTWRT